MIVPDINLLLYAYDAASPYHSAASAWWEACLSGTEPVGIAPVVVFGFARIATSGRVFRSPMAASEAAGHIRSWQSQSVVRILQPGVDHLEQVLVRLEALGTAGNLVTDAQIAAIVMDHAAVLHTSDSDFVRFRGLRWFNPITGLSSRRLSRYKQS